jgi:hypothetical protein
LVKVEEGLADLGASQGDGHGGFYDSLRGVKMFHFTF